MIITCPNLPSPLSFGGNGDEYVIYDLETTGLRPDAEEIIQIAGVRFREGAVVGGETFFSYVRPLRQIPDFITSHTGITNRDVADAPGACEVVKAFGQFVGGARLIAHNGHRFDSKFLAATCLRHRLASVEVDSLDSIHLSKRLFGNARGTGHGLDRLLARLGISAAGVSRHDARGDVELLGKAVERMWGQLGLDGQGSGLPLHKTRLPRRT